MGPYRDPIKALVQCGTGDDVDRVIVDGRTVVEDGRVVGVDEDGAAGGRRRRRPSASGAPSPSGTGRG